MTATIITAQRLEAARKERERQRRQSNAFQGSILAGLLDDEDEPTSGPALPAERKELPR